MERRPGEKCPSCGMTLNSRIVDNREKDGYRYRRRECLRCGTRWNTIEIKEEGDVLDNEAAGKPIALIDRPPYQVREVTHTLKLIASLAGFKIVGKIILRDKETGREWCQTK